MSTAGPRELAEIKENFQEQLRLLGTDYTDMGFVHCIGEEDCRQVLPGGLWDYMKSLQSPGAIRHLGLSSHNPETVRRFLETGQVDMVMFSINPAYDYSTGTYGIGSAENRNRLYRECQREEVGISVMKPFGGGQLLGERASPFRRALSKTQCIQYDLDRPGVLTVLPGVRGEEDLQAVLGYLEAGEGERDYLAISAFAPPNAEGVCVCCNHCQPCPAGLDVGLINKYCDLARAGDVLAAGRKGKTGKRQQQAKFKKGLQLVTSLPENCH